jgi:hypothetical protein
MRPADFSVWSIIFNLPSDNSEQHNFPHILPITLYGRTGSAVSEGVMVDPLPGISKKKALPAPASLSTQIFPWCASTASLQKASPRPVEY